MAKSPLPREELTDLPRNDDETVDMPNGLSGLSLSAARSEYGLPQTVYGRPLGCGCRSATLSCVGKPTPDGYIHADYRCPSNYSNIFRFKIETAKTEEKKELKLNVNGQLVEQEGHQATTLEEY